MKAFLESQFHLSNVHVLYDRPGAQFKGRTALPEKRSLEEELLAAEVLRKPFSKYTHCVVSSTSWTPDEDFSILLEILPQLESFLRERHETLLLFFTGKGECRAGFEKHFAQLGLVQVDLVTAWLPAKDYPLILGLADCGISLHTSTSGLDLPMKAVDMLGAECPVLALRFPALVELLGEGGGMVFGSPAELLECLQLVLTDASLRARMSAFAATWRLRSWDKEWGNVVGPLVEKLIEG